MRTSSASAIFASVSRWGDRSPRLIMERNDTLMLARSLRSSCVIFEARVSRKWRMRLPTSLTTPAGAIRIPTLCQRSESCERSQRFQVQDKTDARGIEEAAAVEAQVAGELHGGAVAGRGVEDPEGG